MPSLGKYGPVYGLARWAKSIVGYCKRIAGQVPQGAGCALPGTAIRTKNPPLAEVSCDSFGWGRSFWRLAALRRWRKPPASSPRRASAQANERQERLESTLLRPSRASAGLPHDPDAKELNFIAQGKHPLRISTEESAKLLAAKNRGESNEYVFLDVREAAEQAMGSLRGATIIRFPDLNKANLDLTNKKVILLCHNGTRSSETCEEMKKLGIDCRCMVGGLEKWIVEGRDMTGMSVRNLAELRAITNYPNRNTLLDTAQVKSLVEKERAVLVDIRYPTDFAENHILGAINLSLRRMPTEVMNERIATRCHSCRRARQPN